MNRSDIRHFLRAPALVLLLGLSACGLLEAAVPYPSPISAGDIIFTEFFDGWHKLDPTTGQVTELPWPSPPVNIDSIRFDLDGAILYDNGNNEIFRLNPRTGAVASLGVPGLSLTDGFVIEPNGDLLIANSREVSRYDRSTRTTSTLRTGDFFSPNGIALSEGGRLFITEFFNDLLEIDPATGDASTVTTGNLSIPGLVVVQSSGDLIIENFSPNEFYRIDPDTGALSLFSDDLATFVQDMALDAEDNLWVSDLDAIRRYPSAGGAPVVVTSGALMGTSFFSPDAIAVVPQGYTPPRVPEPGVVGLAWWLVAAGLGWRRRT